MGPMDDKGTSMCIPHCVVLYFSKCKKYTFELDFLCRSCINRIQYFLGMRLSWRVAADCKSATSVE